MADVPEFQLREGPETKYAQVALHLEARIRAGDFLPGARLAGEQDLAGEYGVALGTMRKAASQPTRRTSEQT